MFKQSTLLLTALITCAFAQTSAISKITIPNTAEIMHSANGDFDAEGSLLASNEKALSAMDRQAVEKQAEQGDQEAQFYLGKMYHLGILVEKDESKAKSWYEKSAQQGNAAAMNNLAILLDDDQRNREQVKDLLSKAAAQKHLPAMLNLGKMILEENQTKSNGEALTLLNTAGEWGYAPAYYQLSFIYEMGIFDGIAKDDKKAFEYLQKSADGGYAHAQMMLSDAYQTMAMTPEKSARIAPIVMAYQWAKRACVNGQTRGCETVDMFAEMKSDEFVKEDKEQCTKGHEQACENYQISKGMQEALKKIDE